MNDKTTRRSYWVVTKESAQPIPPHHPPLDSNKRLGSRSVLRDAQKAFGIIVPDLINCRRIWDSILQAITLVFVILLSFTPLRLISTTIPPQAAPATMHPPYPKVVFLGLQQCALCRNSIILCCFSRTIVLYLYLVCRFEIPHFHTETQLLVHHPVNHCKTSSLSTTTYVRS